MEVTSTPDMVSVITDINVRERDIIEEDLAEVDMELDRIETQFNEELKQVDKEMKYLIQLIMTTLTKPAGQTKIIYL